jgi:MYXO-CTERM domain-containing protein
MLMKIRFAKLLGAVGALALAVSALPAAAGVIPSDSLTVYDPNGNIAVFPDITGAPTPAIVVVADFNEDPSTVYSINIPGIVDPTQFGNPTNLIEPGTTALPVWFSDIFGVAIDANGQLLLSFSSDTETSPSKFAGVGTIMLPEGNGVFDATMYLERGLQAQGYHAQFISDSEPVPTPAALPGALGLGALLVLRRRIASAFKKA